MTYTLMRPGLSRSLTYSIRNVPKYVFVSNLRHSPRSGFSQEVPVCMTLEWPDRGDRYREESAPGTRKVK